MKKNTEKIVISISRTVIKNGVQRRKAKFSGNISRNISHDNFNSKSTYQCLQLVESMKQQKKWNFIKNMFTSQTLRSAQRQTMSILVIGWTKVQFYMKNFETVLALVFNMKSWLWWAITTNIRGSQRKTTSGGLSLCITNFANFCWMLIGGGRTCFF